MDDSYGILFWLFIIVLIYLFFRSENKQKISKLDEKKESNGKIERIKTDRDKFSENQMFLKENTKDHPRYSIVLFETGLLYEKLYNDFFRAACYIYLATFLDPNNKEYEDHYIRLCKIVREKKGSDWEYYITLVNNISDIDKYVEQLLYKNKKIEQTIKKKTTIVKPEPKPVYIKTIQTNTSKFDEFNTESYLHSLGYKVGSTGLNEYQRRRLLKRVLDEGKISKYDVIDTLERNISMFSHRSNRQQAVADWRSDLRYIRENFYKKYKTEAIE